MDWAEKSLKPHTNNVCFCKYHLSAGKLAAAFFFIGLITAQQVSAVPNCLPGEPNCPTVPEKVLNKPIGPPSRVRATSVVGNSVNVEWVDSTTNETAFIVIGSPRISKQIASHSQRNIGSSYSTVIKLPSVQRYCFRVVALNNAGTGRKSNSVCVAPAPPPNDVDRDGIADFTEMELLRRFAPMVWLHSTETSFPVNVEWLLSVSRLRFSHPGCSDHELIPQGKVTADNLINQFHRNVNSPPFCKPWNCCDHEGPILSSKQYTAEPKKSFFLQYPDSTHGGLTNRDEWAIYGHVYPAFNNQIALQYWQLYAYNDSIQSFNHEGDWEYSAILIKRDGTPQRFAHFRHGRVVENRPDEIELAGEHHITFSAKGSHGQYARAHESTAVLTETCVDESVSDGLQGDLIARDKCEKGIGWATWEGTIVNVGERHFPMPGAKWIQYSGLWGEIGAAAISVPVVDKTPIAFTSGPPGPAYQDSRWRLWATSEICANSADDDLDGEVDERNCAPPAVTFDKIKTSIQH